MASKNAKNLTEKPLDTITGADNGSQEQLDEVTKQPEQSEQTSETSQDTQSGGEGENNPEASKEPEASEITQPTETAPTVPESNVEDLSNLQVKNEFERLMDELLLEGTLAQKTTIHNLQHYVEKMNIRAPQSPDTLKDNQSKLWSILKNAVEAKDGSFKERWGIILRFFNEYSDTVFSSINVSRGINYTQLPKESLNAFQRLIHLAVGTCNPTLRASALKQISFDTMLKEGLTSTANRNITEFYNIQ